MVNIKNKTKQKLKLITQAGQDVEQEEHFVIAGGSANLYNFGN